MVSALTSSSIYNAFGQTSLSILEKIIESQYAVHNISVQQLYAKMRSKDSSKIVLFDVRQAEEYGVSHIQGSILLDPNIAQTEFLRLYGADLKDKLIVFYCSVGKRSSDIAVKVQNSTLQVGALSIHNLRGGIFRWYNEGFEVVNTQGITNTVHPFNSFWGNLLNKRINSPATELQKK